MRVPASLLVFTAFLKELAAQCPIQAPDGVWFQSQVHRAISAGKPDATIPRKGLGFNRTADMIGVCTDKFSSSKGFSCGDSKVKSMVASFRASRTAVSDDIALQFFDSLCPLTAVSVYKTLKEENPAFEAQMRFEFEGCKAAQGTRTSTATAAAIVVGIRKDPNVGLDLLPWMKSICPAPASQSPKASTTPAPNTVALQMTAKEQNIGPGVCDATQLAETTTQVTKEDCRLLCTSRSNANRILNKALCSGYAFKQGGTDNCITYEGAVGKVPKTSSGFSCYTQDRTPGQGVGINAQAPTTTAAAAPLAQGALHLDVAKYLQGPHSAYFQDINPPKNSPNCFKPTWWFTLQDDVGALVSVPVKASEWNEFMSYVKEAPAHNQAVTAPQVVDRVLIGACSLSEPWSHKKCAVAAVTGKSSWKGEELAAIFFAGAVAAVVTWLFVAVWFKVSQNLFGKSSNKGFSQVPTEDNGSVGARVCQNSAFQIGMVVVAVLGAFVSSYGGMQFFDATLGISKRYAAEELNMILIAMMLAAALAVIIFCLWLAKHYPHHVLEDAPVPAPSHTKLMLVEVADGQDVAQALTSSLTADYKQTSAGPQYISFTPDSSFK